MISLLFTKLLDQKQNQRAHHADDEAGYNRKINFDMGFIHHDVTWRPADKSSNDGHSGRLQLERHLSIIEPELQDAGTVTSFIKSNT